MDVKNFLESPTPALVELGLSPTDAGAQILLEHSVKLTECKSQLKNIKKQKADIARQFKTVTPDSGEHKQLIEAMRLVSAKIKTIEEQIKFIENELQRSFASAKPEAAEISPPFVIIDPATHYPAHYILRELGVSELDDWDEFMSTQMTTAYHHRSWSEVIKQSFGRPTRIWAAISPEGKILGGVPLTIFDSKLFGRFAVSLPYFNYGGVITPWFNIATDLMNHLQKVCVDEAFSHIEVRTMQANLGRNVSNKKASMILQLPGTDDDLDQRLGAKVRAQYKKAEVHKPQIRFGKNELLDDFYQVFSRNMRDLGTPVYSKKWFGNILAHPNMDAHLAVVYVDNRAVSTAFLVGYRNMLEIPWASTIKEANTMNANMWMYRQILSFAIRQGFQFFDFGRSTQDAGTYKFKKQWGAKPHTHYWYYLLPEGCSVPELNPDNPKYKLMIAIWQRLPVWLTQLIGPPIVRNLP